MASKTFDRMEGCPECGSRDNVGVWSDGQKWCFGCNYFVPGTEGLSIQEVRLRLQQKEKEKADASAVTLPADFTSTLREDASQWLLKYGITKGERIKNRFGWSDQYESLVFPVYDSSGNLLLVQRRYFGQKPTFIDKDGKERKIPKYHTKGRPEKLIHTIGESDGEVIVVEDLLSAIKVGRGYSGMPLWGSELSMEKIAQLARYYHHLILWLDKDKARKSVSLKLKAMPMFEKVSIIISDLDPKEYNEESIHTFVGPHLSAV